MDLTVGSRSMSSVPPTDLVRPPVVVVFTEYNNNNNNNHDNVHAAIIMTKVIARVYPVHLMTVDRALDGCQP